MDNDSKVRAQRNRTIVLSDADRDRLQPLVMHPDYTRSYHADELVGRLVCADSIALLPQLPSEMTDLVVVDPPYNLRKVYDTLLFNKMSDAGYAEWMMQWLDETVRIMKPDASIYICCDWRSSCLVAECMQRCGLTIRNRITWQREKGRGASSNWKNGMEDIWYAVKDPARFYFDVEAVKQKRRVLAPYRKDGVPKDWEETSDGKYRLTCPSNFWDDVTVPYWSMPENTDHPTQKPEKLIAKIILSSSAPGGVVFDPFAGSGTTAVVAEKLGRRWCGIEINPDYVLLGLRRLELAADNPAIQGYSDSVFWERNSTPHRSKA